MKVIFMADQIPEERQYALILVAGGEEAYNCWDTLEDTVENVKDPEQVWDAFEKSFEQSTSCNIGIDLDPSKPKGMPFDLKLHTYSFTTKYINMAKA